MGTLLQQQKDIGANAALKGFWEAHENMPPDFAALYIKLSLVASEVGEAVDAMRLLNTDMDLASQVKQELLQYRGDEKPEGVASEMADIIIRVLDAAEWLGINMEFVMEYKAAYNQTREAMHGKSS